MAILIPFSYKVENLSKSLIYVMAFFSAQSKLNRMPKVSCNHRTVRKRQNFALELPLGQPVITALLSLTLRVVGRGRLSHDPVMAGWASDIWTVC